MRVNSPSRIRTTRYAQERLKSNIDRARDHGTAARHAAALVASFDYGSPVTELRQNEAVATSYKRQHSANWNGYIV